MTATASAPTRVLITGANGRLGRRLVSSLRANSEYEVVAVGGRTELPGSAGLRVDLADTAEVRRIVADARPDMIVHLGAAVGARCDEDPAMTERINVDGTEALAASLAELRGTRFIFASTAAVYGDAFIGGIAESALASPSTLYGKQKLRAEERLAHIAATTHGSPAAVILRIFNVFGEGFDASLVERLRRSTAMRPVELRAMDDFVRDYVHVDDVVDAITLSLSAELDAPATVLNIGSGVGLSTRQLVARLASAAQVFYTETPGRPSSSVADISRARQLLGFDPRSSTALT